MEPSPKRKRIYLATDWERYVEEASGSCTHGSLDHAAFTVSAEGFVTRRGFALGACHSAGHFAVHPKGGGFDTWPVAEHFIGHFDCYACYGEVWEYAGRLNAVRSFGRDYVAPEQFAPMPRVGCARAYVDAKYTFVGFHWHTVLSDECIADYGIDMEAVKALAWRVETLPHSGAAGALYDIRFCERAEDWESVADVMIDLTLRADQHHFDQEGLESMCGEVDAQGAHTMGKRDVVRWREWLYPEGTVFPEA
ncbi:hypothetical protein IV417_15160 [Alphaproteobacteria bacterium KMM 3653]|uniref:Uncharacterized protein n=1 Tax=Harenicola maris TaxID=2841044 RepID=A0AAP2CT11_9RHOB|nr:hypothetical protein [Harenicola maris]